MGFLSGVATEVFIFIFVCLVVDCWVQNMFVKYFFSYIVYRC